MNIDANTPSVAPAGKPLAFAASPRSAGDGAAEGSQAVSFLSMLQALSLASAGDAASPVAGAAVAAPAGDAATAAQATSPAAMGADAGPEGEGPDAAAGVWQDATTPSDLAATVAGTAPAQPAPQAAVPVASPASDAAAMPARAPGRLDGAAGGGRFDQAAAEPSTPEAAPQQVLPNAPDGSSAQPGMRRADAGGLDAGALAQQQMSGVAERVESDRAGGSARAEAAAQASERAQAGLLQPLSAAHGGAGASAVVSMFEAGLAGLRAAPGGRTQERNAARVPLADGLPAGFAAWSDAAAINQGTQPANAVYAPTAATPVPAAALAQKLHYWVAGGVQSAELQLDAFGGGAVDVRIAVKGEEAFVEFRSDQPQARKMLLDAMPQLKELLAGEGLLLSGGFVGGSAQHAPDGGGARPEHFAGARSMAQARAATVVTPALTPARGITGAAVDLFV